MKKWMAIFMGILVAMPAFSGCGKSPEQAAPEGTASDSVQNNAQSEGGDITEIIMQWPSVTGTEEGLSGVEDAINAIIEPEYGIHVTFEPVQFSNLANQTTFSVSSGEQLDLCISIGTGVGSLVSSGALKPLDELVEAYGQDILSACGSHISGGYCGTQLYGIPTAYINGEAYGFQVLTKFLDKYHIEIDEDKIYTLDEVEKIFDTIKAGEGEDFYIFATGDMLTSTQQILGGAAFPVDQLGQTCGSGVLMLDDYFGTDNTDYQVVNMFETEEYKEAAERIYRWNQKGYFAPDCLENTDSMAMMSALTGGNYLGNFGFATEAYGTEGQIGEDMTLIRTVDLYSAAHMFSNVLWSIPVTSKHPEEAMKFLNLLYGEDRTLLHLIKSGIEGTDYEIIEDNGEDQVIKYLDTGTYRMMLGAYGDVTHYFVESPAPITRNQEYDAISAALKPERVSPTLGYVFVTDNVASQYASVTTVISEYQSIITTGSADPETILPEFIEKLKSAGIDDVIAENQKQLDAFLKSK